MNKAGKNGSEYRLLGSGNSIQVISLVFVIIILFIVFIFGALLPDYRHSLMERKRETIREVTQTVYSLLENHEIMVEQGLFTREEAQAAAVDHIRGMRYGADMKDYFWINDMHPVMIMHPYRSELDGEDLSDFTDPEGTHLFVDAVNVIRQNGEGYIEYLWQWQDDPSRIELKLSFVKGFSPWGWIIGSGLYLDDVNAEIASITKKAQLISFLIVCMMLVTMGAIVRYNIIANRTKLEIEEYHRQSEKRFRTVVNSSKDAMIAINARGRITLFNPAAETIFGYASSEVLGKSLNLILPMEFKSKHSTYIRDYFEKGTPSAAIGQTLELPAVRRDGSVLTIDLSLSEGVFGDERFVLAVIRDITQRKELESRLQQSQKMESIGRLAGGIAHDFNNIMTAILGNSELAMMSMQPDSELYADLEEIVENAKRAANLTGQLLAFSRKQITRPQVVDLNSLIANMNKMLQRLISENIDFITHTQPYVWPVFIDPGQIEQVITNLVVNSCDAMPDGGKLVIETKNITIEKDKETDNAELIPGEYVLLKVTDSGTGMDEVTKTHLFEPFYTTKDKGKGTGLGLATCYGIVKQSRGNIIVDSAENIGTAISVYLPRNTTGKVSGDTENANKSIPQGTETVLVVEDEISVKSMIVRTLKHAGYTVYEATNGEEALQLLKTSDVHFDLMVTDLVMPKMSGKELSDRVHTLIADFKILFMSGYIDDTIGRHNILQKGLHFISKPFSPYEIAQKVRDILDGAA